MPATLTYSYQTFEDARNVVVRLTQADIPPHHISLVGRQEVGDSNTAAGAGVGGAAGAATGFLVGLGAMTVPGVGPVVAAGWLISGAVAGALAGGLAGALADAGVPETDAERHAAALEAGRTVVSVRALDDEIAKVDGIMRAGLPVDDGGGGSRSNLVGAVS